MSNPSDSAKRILIVDDDADTCEMIRYVLEQSGYEVTTAGTIADALSLAETQRFDLYLLDNWLPDGTGIDLCQHFGALHPASPILFCSGAAQASDIQAGKSAGAAEYLVKPCDPNELRNMIVGLLRKKDRARLKRQSKGLIDTSARQ
jgi:DNA-binding response OmpR family regulator